MFSLGLSGLVTSNAAAAGSNSGVTSKSLTLGLLSDETGPLASFMPGAVPGAEAAIAAQNARGGVDGRKIKVVVGDTQSSPTEVLTVTQSLVAQKHVFAVMEESALFSLAYKYLEEVGTPAITGLADDGGPEFSDPRTADLVEAVGASDLKPAEAGWSWVIKILKADVCTKLATIAYGASAASVGYANGIKTAAEAAGIKDVDEDNSVAETQTDMTPNALMMRNSGANCWFGVTAASTEEALLTALRQQGANVKPIVVGYLGSFLNAADQGLVMTYPFETPENNPLAGSQVIAAMRKYEGYKGTTALGMPNQTYVGWDVGQLAIEGLEGAGKNLTATSFLKALHNIKAFTAGGIQAPVNLAQGKQGTYAPFSVAGNCSEALKVVGTKLIPLSDKPYCTPVNFYK
jgi:branched-chain amino acid transport system substrate-binding protein